MNPSDGLSTALNEIRETLIQDNKLYETELPLVEHYTSSQVYGQSLLSLPTDLRNKFIGALVNRIAFTKFQLDYFENPLRELAGDEMPLGAIGQNIYVNPARGRVYNINDFAGLLAKYSADVKTEYTELNFDVQYPVTIIRKELEKAFVTWGDFESFLLGISTSLYNGAYIDDYKYTKKLISNAYRNNAVQMEEFTIAGDEPTETELKKLTRILRRTYKDFKSPMTKYNAWEKVGGYGRAIVSWSKPEDIVVLINNDLASYLDVDVLANAFHIEKTDLMGKVYEVDNFDILNDDGEVIFDGSKIIALICDRRWFKIKEKDMFMDEFYNANNRSWQNYLNVIKSFNYSLFANALMLVTEMPEVSATALTPSVDNLTVNVGESKTISIITTPFNATDEVEFTNSDDSIATIEANGKKVTVTGVSAGSTVITAKITNVTGVLETEITVNVNEIANG